jgi:hypothetical protein
MRRPMVTLLGTLVLVGAACSAKPEQRDANGGLGGDGDRAGSGQGGDGDDGDNPLGPGLECATDNFKAGLSRAANIVWVIDNSGSMDEEATLVQQNMNAFVEAIVAAGLEDYRVIVMTEKGFVDVPDPLGADNAHFRYVDADIGSNEGLEALVDNYNDYSDFLLPGGFTHFVVVTDDESDLSGEDFVSQMKQKLGTTPFRLHAVASPPGASPPPPSSNPFDDDDDDDTGCVGAHGNAAAPGVENYAAADLTKGLKFSICEADWSGLFSELANDVNDSARIPCELPIPQPEDDRTVDPSRVNLVLISEAGNSEVVRQVQSDNCSSGGWRYDDPDAPTRIVLCPSTCKEAAAAAELEVAVGCETQIL